MLVAAANHRLKLTDHPPRASSPVHTWGSITSVRARRMAKVALKLTIGGVRYLPIKRS